MSPPLPEDTARLYRSRRGRLAGGVCRGLSLHLGVSVWLVRVVFVLFTWVGGLGAIAYAGFWIFVPLGEVPPAQRSAARPQVRLVLLALCVLGVLVLFGLPMARPSGWRTVLPLAAVALGLSVLWRQADDTQRRRESGGDGQDPVNAQVMGTGLWSRSSSHLARAALGAAVALGGILVLASGRTTWTETGRTLLAALALLIGAALVGLPFFLRILRDLAQERNERVRSQERAEVAAMMHDSVLHTLALIQRHHEDPARVAGLARAQERELREWLYGARQDRLRQARRRGEGTEHAAAESFAEAIRAAAAEVEDRHGARLDVVTVGDAPLDPQLEACVAAAREAMVNAAKYAPDTAASVYAELAEDRVEVFVKDRGPGFDLDRVAPDRMGVRGSIIGRMERHGGRAEIRTAPGEGTEVRLAARRAGAAKEPAARREREDDEEGPSGGEQSGTERTVLES